MRWTLHCWVWRLESPLFIGMPPAGSLNRCRLYVPSRVIHGALAAEIARLKNGGFPDYGKLGHEIALNCRFTYLYPAEKIDGSYFAWLPKYEKTQGMQWLQHNGQEDSLSDRKFRNRLLGSRPGTAVAPETDSASEGTLHETECVNPWWHVDNPRLCSSPVYLMGYVFLRNNGFRRQLESTRILYIGGDTRYGLGKISLEVWDDLSEESGEAMVFGKKIDLKKEDPVIESDYVFGHTIINDEGRMRGSQELLGWWEQGHLRQGELAWVPGSFLENPKSWLLKKDKYGYWKKCEN